MALIKCPECNKEISDAAKTCIHCGYPLKDVTTKKNSALSAVLKKTKNLKTIITGVVVIALALAICFIADNDENASIRENVGNHSVQSSEGGISNPIANNHKNASIREIVENYSVWSSEGGISNPYDRYVFDCENMLLIYTFESSTKSNRQTYSMKFIDDKTIEIAGLRPGYSSTAELTIVSDSKLKISFLNNEFDDTGYYLNKTNEVYRATTVEGSNSKNTTSKLNDDEQRLLKYLKNSIDSFKNPASVRVVEVYAYNKDDDMFYVEISAENSFGGTTKELYQVEKYKIYESMSSTTSIERMPYAFGDICSCDISEINELLKEYCKDMGWN